MDALVAILCSQPVVDVEDVVVVIVVIPIIVCRLAWLGKHPAGIMSALIAELGVAYAIGIHNVGRQLSKWLLCQSICVVNRRIQFQSV